MEHIVNTLLLIIIGFQNYVWFVLQNNKKTCLFHEVCIW